MKGRLEVSVLDATAIASSIIRGDHKTASSIIFLLGIGERLEEWTHKKSVDDLARTMSLNVERVWRVTRDGTEELVDVSDVKEGDVITVRTGNLIPLDGRVVSGEAMVNQAAMTGEGLPVAKKKRAQAGNAFGGAFRHAAGGEGAYHRKGRKIPRGGRGGGYHCF